MLLVLSLNILRKAKSNSYQNCTVPSMRKSYLCPNRVSLESLIIISVRASKILTTFICRRHFLTVKYPASGLRNHFFCHFYPMPQLGYQSVRSETRADIAGLLNLSLSVSHCRLSHGYQFSVQYGFVFAAAAVNVSCRPFRAAAMITESR